MLKIKNNKSAPAKITFLNQLIDTIKFRLKKVKEIRILMKKKLEY
jgi:hypothetical protein